MKTEIQDDRTAEQKKTHRMAVVAKDTFMSGWGRAKGGGSYCAWALPEHLNMKFMEDWVEARSDMREVMVVDLDDYAPPTDAAHFQIYVADEGHQAFSLK